MSIAQQTEKLYISFTIAFDEPTQRTGAILCFHDWPDRPDGCDHIDVSFLVNGTSWPLSEGVIVSAHDVRLGNESECIDRGLDDGDWFFSWEDIAQAYRGDTASSSDEDGPIIATGPTEPAHRPLTAAVLSAFHGPPRVSEQAMRRVAELYDPTREAPSD